MIKKFPSVWEKMSENHGGGFFDSHCTYLLTCYCVTWCKHGVGGSASYCDEFNRASKSSAERHSHVTSAGSPFATSLPAVISAAVIDSSSFQSRTIQFYSH